MSVGYHKMVSYRDLDTHLVTSTSALMATTTVTLGTTTLTSYYIWYRLSRI